MKKEDALQKSSATRRVLGSAVALAFAYMAGFFLYAFSLPKTPESVDKADAIVALTGGDARLDAAVNLLEHGKAKRLLISGVHPSTTKAVLKKLAHGGRRFDCCADLGFSAANTRGNAEEAADWMTTHHFRSLILVTARYHMPRSLAEFGADMPKTRIVPYPVDPNSIDLDGWWHNGRALRVLHAEYAKFLASFIITRIVRKPAT